MVDYICSSKFGIRILQPFFLGGDNLSNGKSQKASLLEDSKALIKGHFIGKDGSHYSHNLIIPVLLSKHSFTKSACEMIGRQFKKSKVDIVVGISNHAGLAISQWVAAFFCSSPYNATEICTEYDNGKFFNNENIDFKGKDILIVRSVLTDGDCTEEVIRKIRRAGGRIVGVGAICNIDNADLEYIQNPPRLYSIRNIASSGFEKEYCPLCKENIPIDRKPKSGILVTMNK